MSLNIFFLDFDGTLVPIAPHPDKIKVPDNLEKILENLANLKNKTKNLIYIITGRERKFIESRLKNIDFNKNNNINIIALHGLDMPGQKMPNPSNLILEIFNKFNNKFKNLFLENKKHSLAFHCHDPKELISLKNKVLKNYNLTQNNLNILHGHNMFEIRPKEASKANAVIKILNNYRDLEKNQINKIIYIGDDITDEEAIKTLNQKFKNNLKTFRVLNNSNSKSKNQIKTHAKNIFENTNQVLDFLTNFN